MISISIDLFLDVRFFLTKKNETCSDNNIMSVDDLYTCKEAAAEISDVQFQNEENTANRPKGCYLHTPTRWVIFNNHSSGSRMENARQICKRSNFIVLLILISDTRNRNL